ncbi:MAG: hypothetical protein DRR42_05145 [Gammaproteobacteria bacterium]|nr:MAG: hypothetical protein DRR42_05145 [Gammaproteobacteria bacterium]
MISNVIAAEMTPAVTYLKGEYALWRYKIPYFSTVLPMKFVADKFSLVDDIQGAESIEWSIGELFQRDISWDRIDKELVKYLKNENRPQFFNALTVALLPVTGAGLADSYKEDEIYEGLNDQTLEDPLQIGGVQIQPFKNSEGSAGRIRWDVNKTIAVAVDGQHRLAAMKRLSSQVDAERLSMSSVPIIFLLPDERAGYIEPPQPDGHRSVITSLRRVFIDLNKHARKVSRARNILLDDLDIPSVCIKTLIGEKLSAQTEEGRLPLSVVDWVSEKNKFESGPFITTILTLHDLVVEILDSNGNFEPSREDAPEISKWLVDKFSVNEEELAELMDRVKRCYFQEIPLTFQPSEVALLQKRFEEKWAPNIVKIFTDVLPYKKIIDYGAKNGLHNPEFVNLYIAEEVIRGDYGADKASKIKANIKLHDETWMYEQNYLAHLNRIDDEYKDGSWAFKVVFQKALFFSYSGLWAQSDEFVEEGLGDEEKLTQFTDLWIEAINSLFESGLGLVETKITGNDFLWAGIGLSAEGNIEYTKVAARRVSDWLNVWVSMYWMSSVPTYKLLLASQEGGIYDICRNSMNQSGISKLVRARDNEGLEADAFEEEVKQQTKLRYEKMRREINKD